MGYTTDFSGQLELNKKLDKKTFNLLVGLNETRRMKRKLPKKYGIEGEFYIDDSGDFGQKRDASIVDYNTPPSTQPSLWCQWRPTECGKFIEWDQNEKFYNYIEWLEYLRDSILAPKGYVLNGVIKFRGEDFDDMGKIIVENNQIKLERLK